MRKGLSASPIRLCPNSSTDLILCDVSVAGSRLDLRLSRSGNDVTTAVTRREGKASLVIVK